jgi:hypothetical protein
MSRQQPGQGVRMNSTMTPEVFRSFDELLQELTMNLSYQSNSSKEGESFNVKTPLKGFRQNLRQFPLQ